MFKEPSVGVRHRSNPNPKPPNSIPGSMLKNCSNPKPLPLGTRDDPHDRDNDHSRGRRSRGTGVTLRTEIGIGLL